MAFGPQVMTIAPLSLPRMRTPLLHTSIRLTSITTTMVMNLI